MMDFKPISLVGCIYKLISRVLARRLFKMLEETIGENQHVFVNGRQILDAAMVANEVVDNLVDNKREGLLCKLDMEKMYNHVC